VSGDDSAILRHLVALETGTTTTNFRQLTTDGVPLPPPEDVPDDTMGVVLWRAIFGLAKHRTFLKWTNHLSDRELYEILWHTVMREDIPELPENDTGAWHVDVPGDDPDCTNYLSYHASEEDRQRWGSDDPTFVLPSRKEALYDRDEDIPRAEDLVQCQEARGWLHESRHPSALATNRFGTTAAAQTFVEQLYAAGASCVIVDHIMTLPNHPEGPYADELLIVLPTDARRRAILELIEHEGRPDTVDGKETFVDSGRGSVLLWWD